jgi:hypothetical protein
MSGITRGFDSAKRMISKIFYYTFCTVALAALGTVLFSGSSSLHGMAKTSGVVKDVLARFETDMTFSPCLATDVSIEAQCAVKNGYAFYRDYYGYRISLASDPDRTPVITFATRDTLKRITTVRSEADLQKFSEAFARETPGIQAI